VKGTKLRFDGNIDLVTRTTANVAMLS